MLNMKNKKYILLLILFLLLNLGLIISIELFRTKKTIKIDDIIENKKEIATPNELGKIPIMMYHDIVEIESNKTQFVGGNVDEDGYRRTTYAFKEDLEFYYNSGYRMIRLADFVDGKIDCEKGYSPIILTFDDGYKSHINIRGYDENRNIIIDENCAVGIMEEMKKKHPDFNVTATFFITSKLFRQEDSIQLIKWLIEHGYDVANHTFDHVDLSQRDLNYAMYEVAAQYELLKSIVQDKYVNIVALPLGRPNTSNDPRIIGLYDFNVDDNNYMTKAFLKVGWEPERSPFDKDINISYLKRVRAYDNGGQNYDIESTFEILEKEKFISDGDVNKITIDGKLKYRLGNTYDLEVVEY